MTAPYKCNKTLLLENNSPLDCMMNGKAKISKITSLAIMELCEVIDESPDYTPPAVMEYCMNDEHEDSIRISLRKRYKSN